MRVVGNVDFDAAPHAVRYMVQAFLPRAGWNAADGFPSFCVRWNGYRVGADQLRRLQALEGGARPPSRAGLVLLAPHVTGFRLAMAMLTHPAWPLPIWRALQIRNRLVLHGDLALDEPGVLATEPLAWRVLDRGVEVDLRTTLVQSGQATWASVVTFYYRGRFGAPVERGPESGAPRGAPDRVDGATPLARWAIGEGARWRYGKWTGDYNGLHQWDWYARLFGFGRAFPHPQRVVVQCLGVLTAGGESVTAVDLWIKGPVPFGSEVSLFASPAPGASATDFWLNVGSDPRPAIVGRMRG